MTIHDHDYEELTRAGRTVAERLRSEAEHVRTPPPDDISERVIQRLTPTAFAPASSPRRRRTIWRLAAMFVLLALATAIVYELTTSGNEVTSTNVRADNTGAARPVTVEPARLLVDARASLASEWKALLADTERTARSISSHLPVRIRLMPD